MARQIPTCLVILLSAGLAFSMSGCSPRQPIAAAPGDPTTPLVDPGSANEGNAGDSASDADAGTASQPAGEPAPARPEDNGEGSNQPANSLTPVPIESGVATLSPDNTKIIFVGTHAGEKPDPRTGGFEKFTGSVAIDEAEKKVKSVVVDIDTNSVWTQFNKLTAHLKSPDFFEVREYPTAKFESTAIETGDDGQARIRGNLTLHGKTKEITIPANVRITDEGLTVTSKFDFNRTDFGMDYRTDQVDDKVSMTVVVGEKTQPLGSG